MDRIISLLAALVGLIALGGAILVHTNADAQRNEMAAQIAQLKLSVDLIGHQTGMTPAAQTAPSVPSAEPPSSEQVVATPSSSSSSSAPPPEGSAASSAPPILPLASPASSEAPSSSSVETATAAVDVKALQDRIASLEQAMADQASQLEAARAQMSSAPASDVAAIASSSSAEAGTPAAVVAGGPTTDCIPLGTRFMASSGDNFPICKTKLVVKVAVVADGFATITGAGDIPAGTSADLAKGCNVMVFSADSTGYAEMRVSCQ